MSAERGIRDGTIGGALTGLYYGTRAASRRADAVSAELASLHIRRRLRKEQGKPGPFAEVGLSLFAIGINALLGVNRIIDDALTARKQRRTNHERQS